jgi:sortase A
MRRLARIVSVALITAGVVILADVAVTLLWKEPLSAAYSEIRQNQASGELDSVSEEFLGDPDVADLAGGNAALEQRAKRLADLFERRLEDGKPIGRIEIPAIDADYVVVQGTEEADLKLGPGHYPDTALPGQRRTVAIAGHRTTYGAPFNQIDKIEVGDPIVLEMPYGRFTYDVTETKIVDPSQTGIVRDVGHDRLVLTSCHPLYSAAQRYAVIADLRQIDLAAP